MLRLVHWIELIVLIEKKKKKKKEKQKHQHFEIGHWIKPNFPTLLKAYKQTPKLSHHNWATAMFIANLHISEL